MNTKSIGRALAQIASLQGAMAAAIPSLALFLIGFLALPEPLVAWLPKVACLATLLCVLLGLIITTDLGDRTARAIQICSITVALAATVIVAIVLALSVHTVEQPMGPEGESHRSRRLLVGTADDVRGLCAEACRGSAGRQCTVSELAELVVHDERVSLNDCFGSGYRRRLLIVVAGVFVVVGGTGLAFGSFAARDGKSTS